MASKEMIRGWQLEQLRKGLQIVKSVLSAISTQEARMFRDGGTGWTVLEVLCHLRDYESLFLERARLTVEQDAALLPNPDPNQLASERGYNQQDLQATYTDWVDQRNAFLTYLEGVEAAAWQRTGVHPRRGELSLEDQLTLIVWHDVNHIEQITRILAERKAE